MAAIKARFELEKAGLPPEQFMRLHKALAAHSDFFNRGGGQHTNGGCHDGRCDYFDPLCSAWTALCEAICRMRQP